MRRKMKTDDKRNEKSIQNKNREKAAAREAKEGKK